jgi:PAS domain S-box-containing protein
MAMAMATNHARDVRAHAELFDIPGHAVIGTTIDGKIVYWSDYASKLFGWQRSEVLGRDIMTITPAASTVAQAEQIMKILRSGEPWSGDFRLRRSDGVEFDARVTDLPVRDDDGQLIGIVGVSRTVVLVLHPFAVITSINSSR